MTSLDPIHLDLDQDAEGEQIVSRNYRFVQVGQPVPIQPPTAAAADSLYDSQNPPSQPLAVSQRFRILFIAHSNGFYVARTKEVMASAEDFKERGCGASIHELSFINPSIGRVSILALSYLDSWLAASVANQIHFFSMSALLHKEEKPSFSVGLDDSSSIKDVKWARNVEKDYVVLSTTGKLYHGFGRGSFENVLDNVDAVEWSAKGDFVAVARKNVLSIMTSQFKERLNLSLSPSSLIVDSLRWVRADSVVLGSFESDDDSEEETYIVQVITTQDNDITCVSSKPAMVSFRDMFLDYRCDVVPNAIGPNLFLSYLENHELAFIASRRNLSQHVVLLGWSLEKNGGVAMIEVSNDAWCAHIESQGNGDDNLILALSVDKVSKNDGMKFILGEKEKEVSPCCVLLCVTVDGKLSLFYFASAEGAVDSPDVFADSDGQEDNCPQVLSEHRLLGTSLEVMKQDVEHVSLALKRDESNRVATNRILGNNVESGSNQHSPSIQNNKLTEYSSFGSQDEKPPVNLPTLKGDNEEIFSCTKPKQERGTQQSESAEKADLKSEQPFRTFYSQGPGMKARDLGKTETRAISEAKSCADSLSGKVSTDLFPQSESKSIQAFGSSEFRGGNIPADLKMAAPSSSFGKFSPLKTFDNRLASSSSAAIMDVKSSGISERSTLHSAGALFQSPPRSKDTSSPSVRLSSSGQRAATMIEDLGSLPTSGDSHVLLGKNFLSGKSSLPRVTEEKFTTTSHPQQSNHEQKLSIQFSNVEVLVKKMDRLLEGIGGKGGFKDASISSQEGSVTALERGLWMMSEECRIWRGTLEERLREIQLLLDKIVQVLARKEYMEGIFQQVTDNWYSDLWNSQKLGSELELKRQHIQEVDQELASQLVQLERHFNAIELSKFGERGIVQNDSKAIRSGYGKARQQSLRSLQNTMCAQLAAAEKLSECLSKQMAELSMECSDSKKNVKKEVFDTLGLTYDGASYRSSHNEKASGTPRKDLLITTSSGSTKEPCRRNLSTPVKSSELQSLRRRRDSLDQKLSSSVPLKTTVKRIILQDDHRNSEKRLPSQLKEQHLKLQLPEESPPAHSGQQDESAKSLFQYKIGATKPAQKSSEPTSTPLSHWTNELAEPGIEVVSGRRFLALKEHSASTASARLNGARESHTFSEKFASSSALTGTSDPLPGVDSRYVPQIEIHPSDAPSVAERILTLSKSYKNSIEIPNFSIQELEASRSAIQEVKPTLETRESFITDSKASHKALEAPCPIGSSIDSLGKVLNTEIPASKNQPGEMMMSSPTMQPNLSVFNQVSSSTSFSKLSADFESHASSLGNFLTSSDPKLDGDQRVLQPHLSFLPSSRSSSTSSLLTPKMDNLSSTAPTLINGSSETLESGSQLFPALLGSKKDENSTVVLNSSSTMGEFLKAEASVLQPGLPTGSSGLSIGPEIPSAPLTKLSANWNSKNQIDVDGMSSTVAETAATSILGQQWPSSNNSTSAIPFSGTALGGKDVSSVNNEDEMEEEAPEGSLATELALEGLGGFGVGSTSTSTVTKPNPFGVELLNKTATPISSPLAMPTPTGELFRPASFNFHSPLPSQPSIAANSSPFPRGFSAGSYSTGPASNGFGQPAQFAGGGPQALGSVLGAFGQSRQLGAISLGNDITTPSGFGSGLTGMISGGFAAAATARGGFAAAASAGTAGAGFASAGFGGFGNQAGGSFSTFGSSSGAGRPPSELFTQMRK